MKIVKGHLAVVVALMGLFGSATSRRLGRTFAKGIRIARRKSRRSSGTRIPAGAMCACWRFRRPKGMRPMRS